MMIKKDSVLLMAIFFLLMIGFFYSTGAGMRELSFIIKQIFAWIEQHVEKLLSRLVSGNYPVNRGLDWET
jgi:hypothetical protein